jgi:molybdopterin-guanine dinucleotide biosynthesis protein A
MVTIAIQAGGASSRMGRDKGLVPLAGKPMLLHLLERIAGLGEDVLITTNHPQDYGFAGVRLVEDSRPGTGALGGLHTALSAARGDSVLVLACDMPFASRPLLEHLLSRAPQADVVIPKWEGEFEPLCAVYARRCLTAVEAALDAGERRMISFFPQVRVLALDESEWLPFDPEGLTFFNVNTPQELAEAEKRLAGRPPLEGNADGS